MEFAFLPKKETVTKNKGAQSLTERVTASDIARALVTIFFFGGKNMSHIWVRHVALHR